MAIKLPHSQTKLDDRELQVRFSPAVREAFHALAHVASKSKHFDEGMFAILREWGEGKPATIHDVVVTFPLIAEQMADHISATHDEAVKDAWRELCSQLPEEGFVVSQSRLKQSQR
jgi:hypothetical protein